ncbi:MAG: hypothetical protein QOJ19_489, partial [Acidimicrobiia bacterium]|nr:hypothetical protein [Acidimicrobiia bacterium]
MADPRAADTDQPSAQATYRFPFQVSSGGPLRTGPGGAWWATHTPDGAGTLRLAGCGPRAVEATAWGPGRHWLLRQVPPLLGASDRPDRFVPCHEVIRRLWSTGPLRLGRTDRVFDALVGAVLGTRVQVEMARRSLVLLAARNGEPAPGPWPQLRVMPSPARLAGLTYPELHRCGIERSRAEVLRRVAAETPRLEA